MANPEHHPASRRSNTPLMVLVLFLGVLILGFLLMAAGFVFGIHIGWTVGLLFIPLGFFGAIVSGIVLVVTASTTARQIPSPVGWSPSAAPGWYPDPQRPAVLRYFDGRAWTASTHIRQNI